MDGACNVVVITGASGSGKSTLAGELVRQFTWQRIRSCTTRTPRPGETPGIDYDFLTLEQFTARAHAGGFLETDTFAGAHYGTPHLPARTPAGEHAVLVAVLTPAGLQALRGAAVRVFHVHVHPPQVQARLARRADHHTRDPFTEDAFTGRLPDLLLTTGCPSVWAWTVRDELHAHHTQLSGRFARECVGV